MPEETIEYPPLSPDLSGDWTMLLRVFGPGAIIASVTVGTGETIFAPRVGSVFGYAMLWVVLAAVVFKAVQVYAGARYIVLTGASVARLVAYPRAPRMGGQARRLRPSIIAFPMWMAALSDALASLCISITGVGAGSSWGRPLWGTAIGTL